MQRASAISGLMALCLLAACVQVPSGTSTTMVPMTLDLDDSGRDQPRIPGGSGCDDPGDIAEHPECRI